ncbi:CPCC family cysteine-rich protein [Aeromonas hydrophila]
MDEPAIGTFDICELCGWEDDLVQNSDPDYEGGANVSSLREAQHAFINKAIDSQGFIKDSAWKILEPP